MKLYRCCVAVSESPSHFVIEGEPTETVSGQKLVVSGKQVFDASDRWFPTREEALLDGVARLEASVTAIFNECVRMRSAAEKGVRD